MSKIKKLRKVLSTITATALVTTGIGITEAVTADINSVSAAVTGDINSDGNVNIADLSVLQQFLTNQKTLDKNISADINSDNKVNVFDFVLLKRTVLSTSVSDVNYIHLNNSSISVEGSNMNLSQNNTVVTITSGGTYQIDGTLNDGQIRVEASDTDKVTLVLNGASVTCSTNAPVYVVNADETVITLAEGSENVLNDTELYSDAEADSTIYSKDDLTINGSGSLTVNSNYLYSVTSNDDLRISGGMITVNHNSVDSNGAAVKGNESVVINGGKLNVTCAADENDKGADGIVSTSANEGAGFISVTDGTVNINSKGGDAIKSKNSYVKITNGTVKAKAEADAIQAETAIDISGGTVYAYGKRGLTTGEGFNANVTGGTVVETANEAITNTAGITVNSMLLNYTEKLDKAEISIKKNGTDVYTVTPDKKYTYVLIANADLANATYNVYTGGTQMTHNSAATAGEFKKSATVAAYDEVKSISGDSGTVEDTANSIVLADSGITFTGSGASLSSDKKTVTISIPGTYTVTGEMTGGQIVVDVDKTAYPDGVAELSLEGMSLENTATSPVYVASIGNECVIAAKNGTTNTIKDGTSAYTNADNDAGAVYSKDDLKFKGKGTLNVYGNYADAIVSKDDVKIHNSTLNVTAVDDGIRGKESVKIGDEADTDFSNLKVTVNTTSGDGIKTTETEDTTKGFVTINGGTVNIKAYADGIQAERDVNINGGTLDIYTYQGNTFQGTSSGSSSSGSGKFPGGGGMGQDGNSNKADISAKGIKAGDADLSISGALNITAGTISIDSSDDCLHCNGNMNVTGGNLTLASADDAMHSDSDLTIGNGSANTVDDLKIYIPNCYEGVEGMNITQNSGTVIVNSQDDGYNAAGGADGSGSTSPGGWNQGGMNAGGGNYAMNLKGGLALVNAANGDHDGFDSNGSLTISGGYFISNGNEPFDTDGSKSYTGGVYVINKSSGGMSSGSEMTSTVSATGSVSAGTRITLADSSNNVIVSFVADKAVSQFTAGCNGYSNAKFVTGGTVSGGTLVTDNCGTQSIYLNGTISGASELK